MLKRILTAAVLIPIMLFVLFFFGIYAFSAFLLIVLLWGAWEWTYIVGLENKFYRLLYLFSSMFLLLTSLFLRLELLLAFAFIWWLLVRHYLRVYTKRQSGWQSKIIIRLAMGWFTLIPTVISICYLQMPSQGLLLLTGSPWLLFYFLVLVCVADSGAYFIGRAFGKRKLAPLISPGKTYEGMIGGVSLSIPISLIAAYLWYIPLSMWFWWVLNAFVAALFSVLGDLFISMLKRARGIKDTGKILPGHGGLLDRVDGILAAAPIFTLGLILLGNFS